jgi:transcription elongation factor Elf1
MTDHEPVCDMGCDKECTLAYCSVCGEDWPCETVQLRATVDRVKALRDRYIDGEKAERKRASRAFLPSNRAKHQESAQQCYWAHDSLTAAIEGRES